MAGYFSIFLFAATIVTGLIWLFDYLVSAPKRRLKIASVEQEKKIELNDEAKMKVAPQGAIAEFAEGMFPVVAFVFVLRSFLYEPFQIPSGSMMPTLLVGDFILVEKYAYAIKNPVTSGNLIEFDGPERGDVAVFKYPVNPTLDYIKRVIGLPGDRVIYRNKRLFILPKCQDGETCSNEYQEIKLTKAETDTKFTMGPWELEQFSSDALGLEHDLLINQYQTDRVPMYFKQAATQKDEWIVPENAYFVMGDNRDNSTDTD